MIRLLILLLLFKLSLAQAAQGTILILNFEIEDDLLTQGAPVDVSENERRLALAHGVMTEVFKERAVFRLADKSSVDAMIAKVRESQALHTCNGCEIEIARQAGADYVLVGWVQKVSNLILNVNAGIKDVKSGGYVVTRSVDLRGNTDPSWIRAVKRLGADLHARLGGEAPGR
ncbi:MAG: DUF3280 domain-containing protein [Burkholderiales bacterium]